MVLKLILCILDQRLRISNDLIQLLHPLGDDSQNRGRFHEENAVLDLFVSVFGGVLVDLLTDSVFGVVPHLLSIGLIRRDWGAPLMEGAEDFLKDLTEEILEVRVFLVAAFNHVIDSLHDLLCIISALFPPENDLFGLTHLADQVEFHLTFVINIRDLPPKGDIGVFHLSLRVLHAEILENTD